MKENKVSTVEKAAATELPFSFRPHWDRQAIPVILWNLTPLLGVIFLGWEPMSVFICYALETVVVGLFNVLKLLAVYKQGLPPGPDETGVRGLGIIPFFLVHYFFFVAIQLSLFAGAGDIGNGGFFSFIPFIQHFITTRTAIIALAVFTANNTYIFIDNYLAGLYKKRTMAEQMFEPYPRIVIQQFVVILGSMFLALLGNGWGVLIIFVGIKLYCDLVFKNFDLIAIARAQKHLREQQEGRGEDNP